MSGVAMFIFFETMNMRYLPIVQIKFAHKTLISIDEVTVSLFTAWTSNSRCCCRIRDCCRSKFSKDRFYTSFVITAKVVVVLMTMSSLGTFDILWWLIFVGYGNLTNFTLHQAIDITNVMLTRRTVD